MNKASGGDGIPIELFQILEDDAVKVLHSICQQIWKTQQWPHRWILYQLSHKGGRGKQWLEANLLISEAAGAKVCLWLEGLGWLQPGELRRRR